MDIGVPLRELGEYDINALRDLILAQDEQAWLGNTYRQAQYDVHQMTNSIVMIFTDGSGWPNIDVKREAGWDLLAEQAVPLMQRILEDHYPPGGTIIRAMAPGGRGYYQAASRQASLFSLWSPDSYTHLYQPQGAFHDRRQALQAGGRQGLRD